MIDAIKWIKYLICTTIILFVIAFYVALFTGANMLTKNYGDDQPAMIQDNVIESTPTPTITPTLPATPTQWYPGG
jgi:hypothetical protein